MALRMGALPGDAPSTCQLGHSVPVIKLVASKTKFEVRHITTIGDLDGILVAILFSNTSKSCAIPLRWRIGIKHSSIFLHSLSRRMETKRYTRWVNVSSPCTLFQILYCRARLLRDIELSHILFSRATVDTFTF